MSKIIQVIVTYPVIFDMEVEDKNGKLEIKEIRNPNVAFCQEGVKAYMEKWDWKALRRKYDEEQNEQCHLPFTG